MKPVLFVTGQAPADRIGAFTALDEREGVHFALFGGRARHGITHNPATDSAGTDGSDDLPFSHAHVRERDIYGMSASGDYRAVVCSAGGRLALPLAWAGARAARVPLILWSALWAHPRTPAHALSYVALARLYRSADAVVTYGPHVSDYVRRHGAKNVHVATQAVDNHFWSAPATGAPEHPGWPAPAQLHFLFVGRPAPEKGLDVLLDAWRLLDLPAARAALVIVGMTPAQAPPLVATSAVSFVGTLDARQLRNFYAAADVLVVPSIPTPTFREPWGLVINEAFNQQLPVVASDAVGAVAGGLVRDDANGVVVPAGDPRALAAALRRLADDAGLREGMARTGGADVRAYTHAAWAQGFAAALASVGASRGDARQHDPAQPARPTTHPPAF